MPISDVTAHLLLDASPDAFVVVDARGRLIFANRATERVFGYEPDELIGQPLDVLLPDDARDAHRHQTRQFFKAPAPLPFDRGNLRGKRKDGTLFPVEVSVAPLEDARGRRLAAAAIRDVTQRREMERENRRRDALHRAIFTKAPIGMAVVDADGRLVTSNLALQAMLGYSAAELEGTHFADITHPDDLDADLEHYERVRAGETEHYAMEKRYLHKDGNIIRGVLRVSALGSPEDGLDYAVGMVEDVTEERSLQEQLFLSQRLEAVGQLAGGIAHDFNNYLTAISGYSQLAVDALPDEHPARSDLAEVLKAADSSARLTRQILAFSRRQVLERRPLDLNSLLTGVRKMLGGLMGEDIRIDMCLGEDLWSVSADPAQIEQVLVNLAVNARDAMPRQGELRVHTENAAIDEQAAPQRPSVVPGEYVLLSVADTGCGMSDDVRDRAFEPFFTTKRPGRGTGLGLATVYGIVKQHGGYIWVDSEQDAGTMFRIYLPRQASGRPAVETEPSPRPAAPTGSGLVLVVEDDERVRGLVARSLESCGYRVVVAPGAAEALELMRADAPDVDLLLTDVVMPGMSGLELADRLREIRPGLPTLFMSGHSAEALERYRPQRENLRWLHKPFTLDTLARQVEQTLRDAVE